MKYILIIFIFIWTSPSFACSCSPVGIKENFKNADLVFKGKLIDRNEITTKENITRTTEEIDYFRVEFKFKVINTFKGLNKEEYITIITTAGGTDCGNNFFKGQKYIIYAYMTDTKLDLDLEDQKTNEFLTTNLCTRTKEIKLWNLPETLILALL